MIPIRRNSSRDIKFNSRIKPYIESSKHLFTQIHVGFHISGIEKITETKQGLSNKKKKWEKERKGYMKEWERWKYMNRQINKVVNNERKKWETEYKWRLNRYESKVIEFINKIRRNFKILNYNLLFLSVILSILMHVCSSFWVLFYILSLRLYSRSHANTKSSRIHATNNSPSDCLVHCSLDSNKIQCWTVSL